MANGSVNYRWTDQNASDTQIFALYYYFYCWRYRVFIKDGLSLTSVTLNIAARYANATIFLCVLITLPIHIHDPFEYHYFYPE